MQLFDSYNESNWVSATYLISNGNKDALGQSFTAIGGTLDQIWVYAKKILSPTGSMYMKIYAEAHDTAFGTDSLPTGAALATSDAVNAAGINSQIGTIAFTFTGANKIALSSGAEYCWQIEYTGGDIDNYIAIGIDNTSPTHSGNAFTREDVIYYQAWATKDFIFYAYRDDPTAPFPVNYNF